MRRSVVIRIGCGLCIDCVIVVVVVRVAVDDVPFPLDNGVFC